MVEQSVSFGCKFSVNLYFDAEQVLHHHRLTNNKDNYLISLENDIKSVSTSVKKMVFTKIPHKRPCVIVPSDKTQFDMRLAQTELRCSHHQMWLIRSISPTAQMLASDWSHPPESQSSLADTEYKSDVRRMQKRTCGDWCQHR